MVQIHFQKVKNRQESFGMELAAEPPRARDDIHPGQGWHNSIAKLL